MIARIREKKQESECGSKIGDLADAAQAYADDHGGKLPLADNWRSKLSEYGIGHDALKCSAGVIYAFNKSLSGLNLNKIKNRSDLLCSSRRTPVFQTRPAAGRTPFFRTMGGATLHTLTAEWIAGRMRRLRNTGRPKSARPSTSGRHRTGRDSALGRGFFIPESSYRPTVMFIAGRAGTSRYVILNEVKNLFLHIGWHSRGR